MVHNPIKAAQFLINLPQFHTNCFSSQQELEVTDTFEDSQNSANWFSPGL